MFDVIVVGARIAGSSMGILLARQGYRVLVMDRTTFPSDTVSTHVIWERGGACLQRWGIFEQIAAAAPAFQGLRFDLGDIVFEGSSPAVDGVSTTHAPRRIVLDKILVDAAAAAGAEIRDGFSVHELIFEEDRVVGIRGRTASGTVVSESARLVVGADGRNSAVAQAVQAAEYDTKPAITCWYYTYWSGMDAPGATWYGRDRRVVGVFPTGNGLTCVLVIWPNAEFHAFRSDIEGNYMRTVALAPQLADSLSRAHREERFLGTADLRNFYRKPCGPGWALVGDAAYHRDPVTGQGISDALFHAEKLVRKIDDGFTGKLQLDAALAEYEQERNRETKGIYEFTCDFARMEPPSPQTRPIFEALSRNGEQANRFMGVVTGAIPPEVFFAPENIQALLGGTATQATVS
jgi:2-polyprenyl-6-methoxyphenol hydroxylase-like FAD-dependent oxidoreductase